MCTQAEKRGQSLASDSWEGKEVGSPLEPSEGILTSRL